MMGVLQRLTGEWGGKLEEAAHREARRAEGRKMLHSAPQRRREGGGRRRTAPGFQPGMPAGCATQTVVNRGSGRTPDVVTPDSTPTAASSSVQCARSLRFL